MKSSYNFKVANLVPGDVIVNHDYKTLFIVISVVKRDDCAIITWFSCVDKKITKVNYNILQDIRVGRMIRCSAR
jgi:hypothetical protein